MITRRFLTDWQTHGSIAPQLEWKLHLKPLKRLEVRGGAENTALKHGVNERRDVERGWCEVWNPFDITGGGVV